MQLNAFFVAPVRLENLWDSSQRNKGLKDTGGWGLVRQVSFTGISWSTWVKILNHSRYNLARISLQRRKSSAFLPEQHDRGIRACSLYTG